MTPLVLIALLCGFVGVSSYWLLRRDLLFGSFYVFFFIYCIFALIGYALFPIVSIVQNMYFGQGVFYSAYAFIALSFAALLASFALLRRRLIRQPRYDVTYAPVVWRKLLFYGGVALFTAWQGFIFWRDFELISYARDPQIPSFWFGFGFKSTILILLPLYATVRQHALTTFERLLCGSLFATSLLLFLAIAQRSGNRTDILAFLLGLLVYEAYPAFTTAGGGLAIRLSARQVRVIAVTVVLLMGSLRFLEYMRRARVAEDLGALPKYARVLVNDYYSPAHMLFASIAFGYVRPGFVLKSNLANSFMVGGKLNIPYLQTDLGNILVPGSSSRRTGMGYFIFTEGYMALGRLGFLYNGLVITLLIFAWRYFASGDDVRYNAYATALCAMFLAVVARSGTLLLVRNLIFGILPALFLFALVTGARWRAPTARVRAA